ncbi:MAG: hypothetical protein NZ951_01280 [Dehalococcoidia bacterium]|nr:hypothetical protein [Dehalococcoidia bacterium]MDW8119464.1 hypothetical protein [Chloroflexota bacterium]
MARQPGNMGVLVSVLGALGMAGGFIALATLVGEGSWASRGIGAGWVLLLSAIILMPLLVPRFRGGAAPMGQVPPHPDARNTPSSHS